MSVQAEDADPKSHSCMYVRARVQGVALFVSLGSLPDPRNRCRFTKRVRYRYLAQLICPFAHPDPVPSQLFQSNHLCVLLKAPLLILLTVVYSRAWCTVPNVRTKACSIHHSE